MELYFNIYAIPKTVCVVFLVFLGIFVHLKKKEMISFSFLLLTLSAAIWQSGSALILMSATANSAMLWARLTFVGVSLIPATLFHFVVEATKRKDLYKYVYLAYIITGAIFVPLPWSGNLVQGVHMTQWGYWFDPGKIYPIYLAAYTAMYVVSLVLLFKTRKKAQGIERNRYSYLLSAFAISLGGMADIFLDFKINIFPMGDLFVVLCLGIIATSITRHKLMGIDVFIRKGTVYASLTAILTAIYVLTTFFTGLLFNSALGITSIWATLVAIFTISLLYQPVKNAIQAKVDQWFFPEKQEFRTKITDLSKSITGFLDLSAIEKAFSATMFGLGITNAKISFGPADMDPTALTIALKAKDETIGHLQIGPKKTQEPYSEDEIAILNTLANQISVAISNTKLHKELLMADKLSSLGRLAAGLAHDIKNPMTAIKSMTSALERNIGDQEFISEFKEIVPKEIDRINGLLNELMLLGKQPTSTFTKVDLNELLKESIGIYKNICEQKGIKIICSLSSALHILGERSQLIQVFSNIFLNAVQSIDNGGTIAVKTHEKDGKAVVEIEDSGKGMPKEVIEHIFEPFFTSKQDGTGIGLAVAHSIIKAHGGSITVSSEIGMGTKFKVEMEATR